MKISGLQKTSLLDYPKKVSCTVFTGGCNFRCPFCHNASLVLNDDFEEIMSNNDFFDFLNKRRGILDGVCITGGEPLIQSDIIQFIEKIKELGFLVKLDTNGSIPKILKKLVENKLVDYVAMDIKNSKENYAKTAGVQSLNIDNIIESVDFLFENNVDFEFRTTLVKGIHTENDILNISEWLAGKEKYYLQNFCDKGDIISLRNGENSLLSAFSKEEMNKVLKVIQKNVPNAIIRGM